MNSFCAHEIINSDWIRLPEHLLYLILEKLESQKDYLQFGAVCVLWHNLMKDDQIKCIHKVKLSHQVPMLIVPNNKEYTWDIYDPMTKSFIESKLVIPYNKRFGGSSEGWLITVNQDFSVTLYKPYSMLHENAIICLPCLFPPDIEDPDITLEIYEDLVEVCEYHVFKAIITADLLTNPNNCVVMVIFSEVQKLAFIRPAKDTTWTKISLDEKFIMDILFHNNKFYALQLYGELTSFDILDPYESKVILVKTRHRPACEIKPYLVKSNEGDILQVRRYCQWHDYIRVTKEFEVFKLNFDEEESRWVEIKSLGDAALFLGDNSSIYVLASNFAGCKSNCIYFTDDFNLHSYDGPCGPQDCGIYNLENKSFETFTLYYTDEDAASVDKMNAQPPIWVVPTFNMY